MPVDYKEYPANWRELVLRVRQRDGNMCRHFWKPWQDTLDWMKLNRQ